MIRGNNQSGLTLIELLISMAIAGGLLAVMVMAFTGQSRSYNTQQEVSSLQEDMWAALQLLSRDIRMGGYDPSEIGTAVFGVTAAIANPAVGALSQLEVTQDLDSSGTYNPTISPEEKVLYSFTQPAVGSATSLFRSSNGGTAQPLIDNITQLDFEFQTITMNGSAAWTAAWTRTPTAAQRPLIGTVKICMQGRTPRQTSTSIDTTGAFNPPSNTGVLAWTPVASAQGNNYQYRTMCVEVKRRNFLE